MEILVGLGGKASAGKDTLAQALVASCGFTQLALAMPIKRALNIMFGWHMRDWDNREWKERIQPHIGKSPRVLAQTLGTEWGRDTINEDLWLLAAQAQPEFTERRVVISDIRFPNEVSFIKRHGGRLIYIQRPGIGGVATHASEQYDISLAADFIISNTSTPGAMLASVKDYLNV